MRRYSYPYWWWCSCVGLWFAHDDPGYGLLWVALGPGLVCPHESACEFFAAVHAGPCAFGVVDPAFVAVDVVAWASGACAVCVVVAHCVCPFLCSAVSVLCGAQARRGCLSVLGNTYPPRDDLRATGANPPCYQVKPLLSIFEPSTVCPGLIVFTVRTPHKSNRVGLAVSYA